MLDARKAHTTSTLADLYDPDSMPGDLVNAHRVLDRATEAAYARRKFTSDADRVAFLLTNYQQLNNTLLLATAAKKTSRKSSSTKKTA